MAITRKDIEGALNSYGYTGSFSDKFYKFLGELGYKGSLSDRIMVWRKAGSPLTKPVISAPVLNSQTVQIRNNANSSNLVSGTARVTGAGVLTGVSIPATSGVVANAGVVNLRNSANSANLATDTTAAVANNTVTGVILPATKGLVTNGQTFTITEGTVTVAVSNNTVTMTFTPTPE